MERVVKTEDKAEGDVFVRYIFGLPIFTVNKVQYGESPEVTFLKSLTGIATMAAHTGMLLDFADSPVELFGPPNDALNYKEVNVGVSQGSFYQRDDWPNFPPCFFPTVNEVFWNLERPEIGFTWRKILVYDAIAFYLGPVELSYLSRINSLFESEFVSSDEWIKETLKIHKLLILPVGDMNYFLVYSNNPVNFEVLSKPLQEAEQLIIQSNWYQENKERLVWDGERSMCLRVG